MKNIIVLRVLLLPLLILLSCSRHVIHQSVREIDRPIFLPRENWQTSLGAQYNWGIREISTFNPYGRIVGSNVRSWNPIFDLEWPSIHFNDKIELNLPLTLRAYLKKNVICVDSIERIGGANIAWVNDVNFTNIPLIWCCLFNSSLLMKKPLSNRIWLESFSAFQFQFPLKEKIKYNYTMYLFVPFTIGYQVTERFSAKASVALDGYYNYYETDPDKSSYNKSWQSSTREYDLDINVPVEFKYAINRNWDLSLRWNEYIYDTKKNAMAVESWVTFTW